jgi:hypothetical protein
MVNFKNMSRKEKMEYIWDYYKLHIIGVIVLIVFIGSFVQGQLTKVEYVSNLSLVGSSVNQDKMAELEKKLTALLVKEGEKRKQALVEFAPTDKSGMSYEFTQRFVVKVAAGEIGVAVLDKNYYEDFMKQSMLLRLDNLAELNLSKLNNSKLEGNSQEQGNGVYAVSVEGNKTLQDIGYDTANKVMVMIPSSKQRSNDIKVFKWILGAE